MKLHEAEFQDEKCDERFRFVGGEQCFVPVVKIRTYFRVFVSRSRFRRSSFCVLVFCVFHRRSYVEVSSCHWRPMTVRKDRRWQTQKKKGWMAGQVRMEELLAKAVTIDCRKEWYCRFFSETNVWTRSKCRRCQTNIPSVLQGTHLQAVSTKRKVVGIVIIR